LCVLFTIAAHTSGRELLPLPGWRKAEKGSALKHIHCYTESSAAEVGGRFCSLISGYYSCCRADGRDLTAQQLDPGTVLFRDAARRRRCRYVVGGHQNCPKGRPTGPAFRALSTRSNVLEDKRKRDAVPDLTVFGLRREYTPALTVHWSLERIQLPAKCSRFPCGATQRRPQKNKPNLAGERGQRTRFRAATELNFCCCDVATSQSRQDATNNFRTSRFLALWYAVHTFLPSPFCFPVRRICMNVLIALRFRFAAAVSASRFRAYY